MYEFIFSRKFKNRNWVFQTTSSGTSPANNCMKEWLGEPVLFSQLPGRSILRIYTNNLVIKKEFVDKLLENVLGKQKSWLNVSPGLLKVLVMLCLRTNRWFKIIGTMKKQISPGGLPSGLFCFPKFIKTLNDLILISQWVIYINTGNSWW